MMEPLPQPPFHGYNEILNIGENFLVPMPEHGNQGKFIVSVHSLKFSDMFMRILQFGQESERF